MPPITKENETLTATPESPARSSTNGDPGAKAQPVALEVPVTVNGARTIDGSDKREPFSETTKTVLIFGNGAVLRLTSSVAPGQLLFLTNERTKKEVVCQVVKSKNYRNVSGYVELEFTEPVVGFWGMRFPGDRIGSAPTPAAIPPAAVSTPVPPRPAAPSTLPKPTYSTSPATNSSLGSSSHGSIVPPAIDSASLLGAAKPKAPEIPAPVAPVVAPPVTVNPPVAAVPPAPKEGAEPASLVASGPNFDLSRQADEQASFLAPPSKGPTTLDLSSLAPFFDVKPATPAVASPPPPTPAVDPETEELKQHTARLQEQLSSMLFAEPVSSAPVKSKPEVAPTPVQEKKELQESRAHVLEFSKPAAPKADPVSIAPVEPVKVSSERKVSSLEEEELKIPAWLEPLARNASAPSSTQELILREKAKRVAETTPSEAAPAEEPLTAPFVAALQEQESTEAPVPEFGSVLAIDESKAPGETRSKGSGKGLLYAAIAAGIIVAAGGGWWYVNQKPASPEPVAVAASVPASNPPASAPIKPPAEEANSALASEPPVSHGSSEAKTSGQGNQVSSSARAKTPNLSAVSVRTPQPASPNSGKASPAGAVNARAAEPAPEEEKKSSLGEVRMAAPKISQHRKAQSAGETDAGVSLDDAQSDNAADALGAGLSVSNKEPAAPAAPLPVGGDVKQAKLISRVNPVYPTLAKNQHVAGNVTIDALIDASGRVTTMKVISGPAMLHQAAMDALKQWKYEPAMLDGKPVPMHLTVTLQFRLQ